MLNERKRNQRRRISRASAPLGRPGARSAGAGFAGNGPATGYNGRRALMSGSHPLTDARENDRLFQYENSVKEAFDGIVPALKKISALQHEGDFVSKAQRIAESQLGFRLPSILLEDA